MRKLVGLVLAISVLFGASPLLAEWVDVTYWKGGITAADREIANTGGNLAAWSWSGGVSYTEGEGRDAKTVTIPRADVVIVQREWSKGFEAAMLGSNADLQKFIEGPNVVSEAEREEGWFLLARRQNTEAAYQKYLNTYKDGNFIAAARMGLADLLITKGDANIDKAMAEYENAARLGKPQRCQAYIAMGMYYFQDGDYKNALERFDNSEARADATAIRYPAEEMMLFAYAGECARQLKDSAKAKERFEHVLQVDTKLGYDATSRAIANFGLAEVTTDPEQRFNYYMTASYWFEGTAREAEALIGAAKVAASEKTVEADDPWSKRYTAVQNAMLKIFPNEWRAYQDSLKAKE